MLPDQLDTAAVRAAWAGPTYVHQTVLTLCDALDAARVECARAVAMYNDQARELYSARAEAAEARAERDRAIEQFNAWDRTEGVQRARAEAAERLLAGDWSRITGTFKDAIERAEAAEAALVAERIAAFGISATRRAEAAEARATRWEHDYWRELARAEAAEAERDEALSLLDAYEDSDDAALINALARAKAAEARIATALALKGRPHGDDEWTAGYHAAWEDFRRALTDGTP